MTAETLLIIAGAVLSLLFSYIPGLASWYNPLDETKKRLIMLGMLVIVTGTIFGLSCAGVLSAVTCDKPGATGLITAFLLALMANQGTNSLSPRIGLKSPLSKSVEITTEAGTTTTVGMKEMGTSASETPDDNAVG